jgi:hypothetical protein
MENRLSGHWLFWVMGFGGPAAHPEFWDWLEAAGAQPGDELIFRVVDGEARQYALEVSAAQRAR